MLLGHVDRSTTALYRHFNSYIFLNMQFAQYVMWNLELGHAKLPKSDFSRACQRAANPWLYSRHGINTIVRELCRLLSSNTGLCAKPDFKAFLGLKLYIFRV